MRLKLRASDRLESIRFPLPGRNGGDATRSGCLAIKFPEGALEARIRRAIALYAIVTGFYTEFMLCRPCIRSSLTLGKVRWAAGLMTWLSVVLFAAAAEGPQLKQIAGLPITRFYSYEDIGDVSRGATLAFDPFGRLVAVNDGVAMMLNDNEWLDVSPAIPTAIRIISLARDSSGELFFVGQGTYGVIHISKTGRFEPESLQPTTTLPVAKTDSFSDILCRPEGVYFGSFDHVAFWDRQKRESFVIKGPEEVTGMFAIGDAVYVSLAGRGVQVIDLATKALVPLERNPFQQEVVTRCVHLDDGRTLLATDSRKLLYYENGAVRPFPGILGGKINGTIAALAVLANGNLAVAIRGAGLFFVTPEGSIVTAFTAPDYRQISALATDEPGVLWVAAETGIAKVLYSTPITWFGQALGLSIMWPQVVRWRDRIVIASGGIVWESETIGPGEPVRFHTIERQPRVGVWAIATHGEDLLVGNGEGISVCNSGGPFKPIASDLGAERMVMLNSGTCIVIGPQIGVLRRENGEWRECAPRVPGLGYPSIVHASENAAWVEIGTNRVARIEFRDGQIHTRLFEDFPWKVPRWVNVSVIGDVVLLASEAEGRLFFDERTGSLSEHSRIEAILEQAPYRPVRVQPDDAGTWWVSHAHGMFTMTPNSGNVVTDTRTYQGINDHVPMVQTLPGGDVWLSRGSTLYHVDAPGKKPASSGFRPQVVSVQDVRTGQHLQIAPEGHHIDLPLAYNQNNLELRLFAGSYAWKQLPSYEYRINKNPWTRVGTTSELPLSDLHEGNYHFDVRLVDDAGPLNAETWFELRINPPWYRTWYADTAWVIIGFSLVLGGIRLALKRVASRNAELERTVAERTAELKATMLKLQQETQIAATLAERNRLAGEIHDSLEQGFSALMLHLETTAEMRDCPAQVRNALGAARHMVAYSRSEVRHAVTDLQSPLLDSGDLAAALRSLVAQFDLDPEWASVRVTGTPRPLGSTTEHHLLRIGQEAIANAVKHAEASKLEIELAFGDDELELTVRDNGRGFGPDTVFAKQNSHVGLRSLRGRAIKIQGVLTVSSSPGQGTQVKVRVPYETNSNHRS